MRDCRFWRDKLHKALSEEQVLTGVLRRIVDSPAPTRHGWRAGRPNMPHFRWLRLYRRWARTMQRRADAVYRLKRLQTTKIPYYLAQLEATGSLWAIVRRGVEF